MRDINKSLKNDAPKEDLDFKQWKEELNKELNSYWKSLLECYEE